MIFASGSERSRTSTRSNRSRARLAEMALANSSSTHAVVTSGEFWKLGDDFLRAHDGKMTLFPERVKLM